MALSVSGLALSVSGLALSARGLILSAGSWRQLDANEASPLANKASRLTDEGSPLTDEASPRANEAYAVTVWINCQLSPVMCDHPNLTLIQIECDSLNKLLEPELRLKRFIQTHEVEGKPQS